MASGDSSQRDLLDFTSDITVKQIRHFSSGKVFVVERLSFVCKQNCTQKWDFCLVTDSVKWYLLGKVEVC